MQFADWFKALDPYKHPVVIHTNPNDQVAVYSNLYGHKSYDGASLQSDYRNVFNDTLARIQDSATAGNPWVVANDEQGSSDKGVLPDSEDPNHDSIRREVLWGNIMVSTNLVPSFDMFRGRPMLVLQQLTSCSFRMERAQRRPVVQVLNTILDTLMRIRIYLVKITEVVRICGSNLGMHWSFLLDINFRFKTW